MTLGTHAIVGAAAASLIPEHPVLAFCAGFALHFAADAIPHYDYPIHSDSIHPEKGRSMQFDTALLRDMADFSFDAGFGIIVSLLFFATPAAFVAVCAGMFGGMLPDALQFVYTRFKHQPLLSLQRFHKWIHTKRRLRDEHRLVLGLVSQGLFIFAVILAAKIAAAFI